MIDIVIYDDLGRLDFMLMEIGILKVRNFILFFIVILILTIC